jgi:site-specific recombinase XerD
MEEIQPNLPIQLPAGTQSAILLTELTQRVEEYVRLGLEGAPNSQRAYTADLKNYTSWCEGHGQQALPASTSTLAAYAAHLAKTCKWATLTRRIATVSKLHQLKGFETPTTDKQFRVVMEGVKRSIGIRQKQAKAFTMPTLKGMLKGIDCSSAIGLRNKALLLLGFTGAFRRSELVALNVDDLDFSTQGLIVSMGKSKTNQYGASEEKAIYYSPDAGICPIRTLQSWLTEIGRSAGPLFVRIRRGSTLTEQRLTDQTVYDVVKKYLGNQFSAHSLRASFVTIAKMNGADDSEVMRQTKHRKSDMIQRYTRIEDIRLHNAAMKLGL